jgi:hypothetical protein
MTGFPSHRASRRGRHHAQGISLVVVVALVGLLMLLTVSLLTLVTFSRQTNDLEAESRKSEVFAQAAFHAVVADLTDEMKQGAASVTESRLDDGTTLRRYDFTNKPASLTVARAVKSAIFNDTALVKQSGSGVRFHPHGGKPAQRASAESTTAGSEPLDPSLWAKPRLLRPSLSLTKDTSPDWIYVTRDGSNPLSFSGDLKQRETSSGTNPKFVIGRYAFNLYDTSGLLDLNAAGHPTDLPGPDRVGHKGSLALADLAGLPGMTPDGVTELTHWKHLWSAVTPTGTAPDGTVNEDDYIRRSEGSGWQQLAHNDNVFLNRQDLLRFAKLRPQCLPDAVLPLFTHFSRDLDAPSWLPHPKRPKVVAVAAQGGNDAYGADDQVNPDLMAFSKSRQAFLLQRRFPLDRLQWVATPGKDGPLDPAKAERFFGLRWATGHWVYTQARSNGDLYTLQEVPAGREPNFFEILRAAVLCGSLGRQFGATGFAAGDELNNWSHKLGGIDGSINLNILEMGACLIDQADADSYPTAVSLQGSKRDFWAFGKEDVPYLYRTIAVPYRSKRLAAKVYYDNGTLAPTETYEVAMTLQVGLWRPHQPAQTTEGPEKFRIRPQHVDLFGGSMFYLQGGWPVPGKPGGVPYPPNEIREGDYSYWGGPNYRTSNPELFPKTFTGSEFIEVEIPQASTAFREPQTLHSDKHASANGYTATGATVAIMPDDLRWAGVPSGFRSVYGFLAGRGMTARMEAENGPSGVGDGNRLGQGFFRGEPIEFLLEYQAEDGSWRPYQRAEFSYFSTFSRHFAREPYWKTAAWEWGSFLIDPRTARFGGIGGTHQSWCQSVNPINAPQSGPDAFAPRLHWPEGAAMRWENVQSVTYDGAQLYSGVWSWWRQPAKNTGWNFNKDVEWWMNMNHAGCLENDDKAWNQAFTLAYLDPDGVLRQGVGADNLYGKSILGNPMSRRYAVNLNTGKLTTSAPLTGRPRVLNRPFRSVGELAYAFRGTPWRDIDFLRGSSPDAGLLDVFSLYDDPNSATTTTPNLTAEAKPPVVAGRVNLNTASEAVLAALLRGTAVDEGRFLDASLAAQLAKEVYQWLHATGAGQGPLASKAGLVGSAAPEAAAKGLIYQLSGKLTDNDDRSINDRREVAVRALADGTTVRAWNFLLDLVVQTGQLTSGATSLQQFQAAAERRFWVHFAIDRPTGQLIAVEWEPVVD